MKLKEFYGVLHMLVMTYRLWINITLTNAVNDKQIWRVRRLQTIDVVTLWIVTWLRKEWKGDPDA